ncbi:MAG: SDR family NAD(P)-dependent oxidoreductase [Candidatus Wallbacteria bacterium]|nr:SDR family NAD(P)-dependent oxidoreductase [Candidatus Wallbacteria bacterium]
MPFAPAMIAQGTGVLSAVSSVLGFFAVPGRSPYCASKAAVHAFMNGLRMDLHGTGVHAMTFCPGYVRTPLTAAYKKMLFAVDVDEAVRIMATAVERRVRTVTFPWQMCVLKEFLRRAPEAVVRRVGPPPRDEE